jgi:hypothetical protein
MGVTIMYHPISIIMNNFIEDYLACKTQALASAKKTADNMDWCDSIDNEQIYAQLASPEFRLYEEMVCF